jgi:FAD/FMN-containing dehydrogenase
MEAAIAPSPAAPSPAAPSHSAPTFAALADRLTGSLILPNDPAYDETRGTWNLHYAARPAAIVQAADSEDIAEAVRFAREHDLEIAVRSGGHSLAGHSTGDGVLVIDLRGFRSLHIDPQTRLVSAGAGLTAGEVTTALIPHGLAIPFGDTGSVGIAGLTLGGGIGYLVRKAGLAIDRVRSMEMVSVDGEVLTVSKHEHPDLFWALRGGGGNFGIVTRFVYEAVSVTETLSGALVLPLTADTLRGVLSVAAEAPDELSTIAEIMPAPPAPFIPAELVGTPVIFLLMVWAGDPAEGQPVVDRFRTVTDPIADLVEPMPYGGIYAFSAEAEVPSPAITRSLFADRLLDEASVQLVVDRLTAAARPAVAVTQIRVLGGQLARVPADATAFAHRDARVMFSLYTIFVDPEQTDTDATWTADYFDRMVALTGATGAYVNFLDRERPERLGDAYPPATLRRLAETKARWDPHNVLRRNQNIAPLR